MDFTERVREDQEGRGKTFVDDAVVTTRTIEGAFNLSPPCHIFLLPRPSHICKMRVIEAF